MTYIKLHRRTTCRLCDGSHLELVVALKPTPVSEKYITKEEIGIEEKRYPLDLYMCSDCGHVQLIHIVDPEFLFDEYTFKSSSTGGLVRHFDECADEVTSTYKPPQGSLIIDIGSNDGSLLKCFQKRGMKVLGVDPAREIARLASVSGVETIPEFMRLDLAYQIKKTYGKAKIVTAFNAFAHSDNLVEMVNCVSELLDFDGIFVFEISYLLDVIDHKLLGTIFHEHMSYHSLKPLVTFLHRHGIELIDVKRVTIQGGSLVGTAQLRGGKHAVKKSVLELLALEEKRHLSHPETLKKFGAELVSLRNELSDIVGSLVKNGHLIAGFGAARSGTTLMAQMELGDKIKFIVDDNPDKQNKFSPGDHIPICPTEELYRRKPSHVFILAWIHAKKIVETHQRFLNDGGRFIVCFPRISIIGA